MVLLHWLLRKNKKLVIYVFYNFFQLSTQEDTLSSSLHYFGVNTLINFIFVLSFSLFYLPILCFQNNKYTDTLTLSTLGDIQSAMIERTTGDGLLTGGFSSRICSSWWLVNHFSRSFGQSVPFHLRQSSYKQTGATGEASDGDKWRQSCVCFIRTWNWGNLRLLEKITWKQEEIVFISSLADENIGIITPK